MLVDRHELTRLICAFVKHCVIDATTIPSGTYSLRIDVRIRYLHEKTLQVQCQMAFQKHIGVNEGLIFLVL